MVRSLDWIVVVFFIVASFSCPSIMAWRKFETCGMVPKAYFDDQRSVYGLVERVIDGDAIRVRHLPLYSWRLWAKHPSPLQQRGIAQETMSIRLYAVDCPELAKRGHKAQAGSAEAKQFLKELIEHSVVRITFLRRDQYARAVAVVELLPKFGACFKWIPYFGRRDLSMILAKEGHAELYTGGGAEYWGKRDKFEQCIAKAQEQRRGIWNDNGRISAAEHKQRIKNGAQPRQEVTSAVPPGGAGRSETSSNVFEAALTGLEFVA